MPGIIDTVLDASIYFSFDASGYRRHARHFDPSDLSVSLSGRRCLVTGANSGIGFATASGLAGLGAEVWLLCRNEERGNVARDAITAAAPGSDVHLMVVDVADLGSVRRCAETLPDGPVDVLVHNAGAMPLDRQLTEDGLETAFAVHVAGPFALTHLLRSRLAAAHAPRIVWISSGGMYAHRLSLEDVQWSARPYDGVAAYAQTKRMQVVLNEMFAERWEAGFHFHAMHPGWADTVAVQTALPGFRAFTEKRLRSAGQGADTAIWLAAARQGERSSGRFWFDRMARSTCLVPFTRDRAGDRDALWALCESVTAACVAEAERV